MSIVSDTALCFTSIISSFGDKRWRSSSSSFVHECWVIVQEQTQPQISVPSYEPGASPQHSLAQVRRLCVLFRSGRFRDPCCPHQGTAALPKRRKCTEDLRADFRGQAWKCSYPVGQNLSHALSPTASGVSKYGEACRLFFDI